MFPPVFDICSSDTSVQSLLGDGPTLRLYPFGEALQKDKKPYAVWQVVDGEPGNFLGEVPDSDQFSTAFDVYGATAESAREVVSALVAAIEPHGHVVSWDGERRDPETRAYHVSFTVDWIEYRP
jgi:hypothetical protein